MLKILFKFVYYLFIVCVLAIALLLAVSFLPIPGNYKVLVVQSGSMEPSIKTGAIVVTKPEADYKVGDVVTFDDKGKEGRTITHRIIEVKQEGSQTRYVTKGDANNAPDQEELLKNRIVGKVIFSVPYVGYAVEAAKKPLGFVIIIVVPAAIIIGDEIKKIWQEVAKMRKKPKVTE